MKEHFEEKYVKFGVTLFLTGAAVILFFFFIQHFSVIHSALGRLVSILMPFIYGTVMAYLLCPIYNTVVRSCYHRLHDHLPSKKAFLYSKIVGSVFSLAFLFLLIGSFLAILIPQIIQSIITLVDIVPGRLDTLSAWIDARLSSTRYEALGRNFDKFLNNSYVYLRHWLNENILPNATDYISKISEGVFLTLRTMLNLLIGIIVVLYFLNNKDLFRAQGKKIIVALCNREKASEIMDFANFANRTFGGFINGKIIDSLIIGVICFVAMLILKIPYPALCASIIGVTNIIPFFGPFIGAVPTALIICVVDPIKAGEFLILVFALQQFDGNILGPKILGETTGLASFWVMFSIILFGGLFGFVGMIVGVPVFAVFYHYFKSFIEKRLRRRGLEERTKEYQDFNQYDINRKDLL